MNCRPPKMCTKTLSCILCGQPNFPSIEALRVSLLKVTARPLKCPICGEEQLGLDKLTIHLFGHSLLEDHAPATEPSSKNDAKRNTAGSVKNLRKVRRKESSEAEMKCSENGSDIGLSDMLPTDEHIQCFSNAQYCPDCDVEFRNPTLLKMHREVFHEYSGGSIRAGGLVDATDNGFVCHICPKKFKMKGSLKIHMRVVHSDRNKSCMEEVEHASTNTRARVDATPAPAVRTPTTLVAVVHNNDALVENDIVQPIMSVEMLDQQQNIAVFQSHLSTADGSGVPPESHIIQIIDPRQLAQVVYLPPSNTGEAQCGDTDNNAAGQQQFTQESTVHQHRMESHSLPSSPQQQGPHDNPKQWECDVCRKSFTTKYFLKKHNRLHTGEMPYTCGICGKSFTFQQSYHKHLLYHSDEKPHVCSVCNRAFKELSTLHNHERIHSGEKPFACETCGKCFRQRVSYLVHRRIHTGLMPYKCSGCEKSFRYKVSQRTHKCPASPPGTVVRKTGDLLQKLLQSSAILPDSGSSHQDTDARFIAQHIIHDHTRPEPMAEEDKQTADYVNRTLDELVQGTYVGDKLDNGGLSSAATLYEQPHYGEAVFKQPVQAHPSQQQQQQQQEGPSLSIDAGFPRIENLCLLSPSAFDNGQLEDLDGLKLDNGW